MTYKIHVARTAERYLRRLDRVSQQRILRRLGDIAADPYGPETKPLRNAAGRRSARVGGWRVVFLVDDQAQAIDVRVIAPRGQAYRNL